MKIIEVLDTEDYVAFIRNYSKKDEVADVTKQVYSYKGAFLKIKKKGIRPPAKDLKIVNTFSLYMRDYYIYI